RVIASGRGTLARWEDRRRTLAEVKGPLALKQTQPSIATLDSWPFVTGVPLPRGQVADASQACLLDGKGQIVPAQFEALTHWSPKRGSIKWLRVAFTAPTAAGAAPNYELQFGPKVKATPVGTPVQVTDGVSEVTVDTGAITLRISKTRVGAFSEVVRKKKGLGASAAGYKAAPDDGPYVIDHAGAVFRASLDAEPDVTVEETGPVRAVVRVEAWHVRDPSSGSKGVSSVGVLMDKEVGPPAEQERLNKSVLRYYAYAGQPWVQLDWTFIVTTDTDAVRFKDIGLRMTGSGSARIGLDGDQEAALADGYLLQKKADSYVVRQKQGQSYAETSRGSKAPGWIANDSFSLTMRDFWQMFPKELETKSEIRNLQSQIILHAWPGHGEWNPDWFAEPTTAPATDAVPQEIVGATGVKLTPAYLQWLQRWHHGELLDFHYPDWWRQANIAGTKEKECWLDKIYPHGNRHWEFFSLWSADSIPGGKVKEHALGASRTQQALLDFSGDKAATMAARRSMFLSQPHVWLENPKWLEETQVLGPVHVAAAQAWDQPALDGWQHLDKINYYGMWLYGNMPEYFEPDGSPLIYRQINGSPHYGFFNTGWLLYLATGNPAQLKFAQANAHHWRDISIVHYTTPEFSQHRADRSSKVLGAAQAVGLYPFRLGSVFDFYSGTFHLLMDYYLTGDRRSLEVAKLHTENLMKKRGGTGFTREAGGNQKTMLDWYAHSWDPVVAEWIDNGILSITTGDPTTEKSKSGTKLNWTNFMPQYLDLTSQPDIPLKHRKELLAYVEEWCKEFLGADNFKVGHPGQPGNMLAAAWFATGDVKYLYPFMRGAFRAELPREQWLVPTKPDKGCGPGGAVYFDEMLYSYAAWRDAVEKKLIPVSEADLPVSPPPIKSYRCPVWEAYKGKEVTFVFLKPAGEELRVNVGTYSPGGLLTFTGPDGKIVLQTKTEKGEFKPQLLVVSAKTPAGVYRLHINTEPHKFWATIQTTNQHMVECPKAVALFADAEWMFHVPSHVERFTVRMTTGTKLVDPAFKTVAVGKALYNGQVGEPMVIEAKPEHRGKLWRFRAVHMSGGDLVQIEGVPGYLAAHPSWWFPPPGR
ncbi:MAG: hypothetical protein HY360_07835, partial [Verrucomicrobia bacterium]|nr:hypothetical protein [Verrucomicrobiota bacterium]